MTRKRDGIARCSEMLAMGVWLLWPLDESLGLPRFAASIGDASGRVFIPPPPPNIRLHSVFIFGVAEVDVDGCCFSSRDR